MQISRFRVVANYADRYLAGAARYHYTNTVQARRYWLAVHSTLNVAVAGLVGEDEAASTYTALLALTYRAVSNVRHQQLQTCHYRSLELCIAGLRQNNLHADQVKACRESWITSGVNPNQQLPGRIWELEHRPVNFYLGGASQELYLEMIDGPLVEFPV